MGIAVQRCDEDGGCKRCANCGTTSTPMWRKGVQKGALATLCNACGIRLKRGKCCPYCQVTYEAVEAANLSKSDSSSFKTPEQWLCCGGCSRWVHRACHQKHLGAPPACRDAFRCPECVRRSNAAAAPAARRRAPAQHSKKGSATAAATKKQQRKPAAKRERSEDSGEASLNNGKSQARKRENNTTTGSSKRSKKEVASSAAPKAAVPTKKRSATRRPRAVSPKATASDSLVEPATQLTASFDGEYAWEAPPGGWGAASQSPSLSMEDEEKSLAGDVTAVDVVVRQPQQLPQQHRPTLQVEGVVMAPACMGVQTATCAAPGHQLTTSWFEHFGGATVPQPEYDLLSETDLDIFNVGDHFLTEVFA